MENCIVTKLKGVVNNDLRKLGEARIKVNSLSSELLDPNGSSQKLTFGIKANKTVKIKIIGEGHLSTTFADLDSSTLTEITFVDGEQREKSVYFSVGDYEISIIDKYNIYEIANTRYNSSGTNNYIFEYDMSEFYYSGLTRLYLRASVFSNFDIDTFFNTHDKFSRLYLAKPRNTTNIYNGTLETIVSHLDRTSSIEFSVGDLGISGDISALEGIKLADTYLYNNPDLTGNISVLGTNPQLSSIQIYGCPKLYGTIESIVKNWVTVCGITSGNISPKMLWFTESPLITFNGVQARSGKSFSWTSNETNISITYDDVTVSVPIN